MTYSNWHGRCPGGEQSERGDVRAGKCPAGGNVLHPERLAMARSKLTTLGPTERLAMARSKLTTLGPTERLAMERSKLTTLGPTERLAMERSKLTTLGPTERLAIVVAFVGEPGRKSPLGKIPHDVIL